MSSMFFGQYLLETGVIRREALLDAFARQRRSNRSLTRLAAEEGLISEDRASQIDFLFRTSEKTLEALCMSEGRLTREQVDRLLAVQRSDWLRIGSALVEGGHLTRDEVERHLTTFQAREEAERQNLEQEFAHLPDTELVRACSELTLRHVARATGAPVKLRDVDHGEFELADSWYRFAQQIVGDRRFCIAVDLPPELVAVVASGMLGMPLDGASEAAQDAGCEFINLIGGNACTRLEMLGLKLRPEPPIASGVATPARPSGPSVRATAMAGDSEFALHVFTE